MSIEIERKFIVSRPPAAIAEHVGTAVRQGYLIVAEDGTELRVRQKGERFFQTIKSGEGLRRTEIEIELSQTQFDALWPHTENRRVSKTRYQVPLGEHTGEVDIFEGSLDGLVMVEVEFTSEADSQAFTPPAWFGEEVTEHGGYKNKRLAIYGIPEERRA